MTIIVSLTALRGWLVLIVGLFAVGGFAAELADDLLKLEDRLGFHYFFGLSYEENLPTWYISCLLFSCSVLLALTALRHREEGDASRWHWWGLAGIFAYISLDEFVQLHEEASHWFDFDGVLHFGWVIPAAIFVTIIGLLYVPFLRRLPGKTRNRFVLAGVVYVGGALGMELPLGYWTDNWGSDNLGYGLLDMVEETLEIAGISIFFFALVEHLCGVGGALRISLAETPSSLQGPTSDDRAPGAPAEPEGSERGFLSGRSFGAQVFRTLLVMCGILVVWLAAMQALQYGELGRRLTGEEINKRVTDHTLFGSFDGDGTGSITWVQYFVPDGRVVFFMDDELHHSTWRVTDDRLCFRTESDEGTFENCLRVYEKGETIQFVLPTLATLGDLAAIAARSEAGNVEDMPLE